MGLHYILKPQQYIAAVRKVLVLIMLAKFLHRRYKSRIRYRFLVGNRVNGAEVRAIQFVPFRGGGGVSFKFPPNSFKDALRLDASTTLSNSSFRGIDYQEGDTWGNPEA